MTTFDSRTEAARAYVQAVRTGEHPAIEDVAKNIAPDVTLVVNGNEVKGKDQVVSRVGGIWPNTAVYVQGSWSAPRLEGDQVKVDGVFPPLGAAPKSTNLVFSFNGEGQINRIEQTITPQPAPETGSTIPDVARGLINGALANNTPMSVAYVDEEGRPVLSLRGSVQVYSDDQLCAWIRNADGGLARALEKNPNISMLYRDSRTRTTLLINGRGRFDPDPAVRERVFGIVPEVEKNHDPGMVKGGALIIDVDRIQGGTTQGGVRMQRAS